MGNAPGFIICKLCKSVVMAEVATLVLFPYVFGDGSAQSEDQKVPGYICDSCAHKSKRKGKEQRRGAK